MRELVWRQAARAFGVAMVGAALVIPNAKLHARVQPEAEVASVALSELPSQARTTYRLILQGGPFPYEKDGTVFGNRERLLPQHKRGYYREYTVRTPWARDRGGRRIVCGGEPPTQPDVCYYTGDHYNSFRKITP